MKSVLAILVVAALPFPASAAVSLTTTPLTWGVIGLDSNDVTTGPNVFPVGARVCNTGSTPASATATFVWDSTNAYLDVAGPATVDLGALTAGACRDAYFNVAVTRDTAAYFATRRFHVRFAAGGVTASTPVRELYVEKLISQNRNDVLGIVGPATLYYGGSYTITITSDTAPNGYEQVESFLSLPTDIFRIDSITTSATASTGDVRQPYFDACTWDANPLSATYRTCLRTGKAGGTMVSTYRVTVVGLGSGTASNAVYDFSGSSYHYNTDWGAPENTYTFQVVYPDLSVTKAHAGTVTRGADATYTLTIRNTGTAATNQPITVVDTLPAGLTYLSGGGDGFSCVAAGRLVTCTRTAPLAPGASAVATLVVRVAADAPETLRNTARLTAPGDPYPANDTSTDLVRLPPLPAPAGDPAEPNDGGTDDGGTAGDATDGDGSRPNGGSGPGGPGVPAARGGLIRPGGKLPFTGAETRGLLATSLHLVNFGAIALLLAGARRRA